MRTFSLTLLFASMSSLVFSISLEAQDAIEHRVGDTARAFHIGSKKVLKSLPPSAEAIATVGRIMDSVGLKPNFSVRASTDVANAEAIVENSGKDRYILYNPSWFRGLLNQIDTSWAETSILAHEIGHQLQFHMDPRIGNYDAELEADRWSGFVLQRLGAPIEAAQLAMAVVASDAGSVTHPPKADRLKAIAEGWKKAAAAGAPAAAAVTSPTTRPSISEPLAPPESAAKRVSTFTYMTSPSEVDPGLRVFKRQADGNWTNTYPSGFVENGLELGRFVVDGCTGTIIGKEGEQLFSVFIPDKGCPGMMARWKRSPGSWNILGPMKNIR